MHGARGESHMKGVGMLVISFRGVNFGFWSHLGCSGKSAIIFCHKYNTFRVTHEEM